MVKIILKTALYTLLAIIVLLGIAFGGLILFAPHRLAKAFEDLGLNSYSIKMYERVYIKDKTVENLHMLVSKSIVFESDDVLIEYYPQLESHEDYETFIEALDNANYNESAENIVNVKLSNEDNRLKTRYVSALAKKDFDIAFEYAVNDLKNIDLEGFKINFVITGLAKYINETNVEKFVSLNAELGYSVCQKILYVYNDLKVKYESGVDTDYKCAIISGKLIDMLQFMLLIEGKTQNSGYDKTALTNDLAIFFAEYKQYIE